MHITFHPERNHIPLTLEKSNGDRLRINGELFNFNGLAEGDQIPCSRIPCRWIINTVERINGEIHIDILLPHGANPSQAMAFPEPITVTDDGPIDVPFDPEPVFEEPANVEP